MTMTVLVTRNVESRVRGFLASAMLEIAAGVYVAPQMSPAVRDRIWEVLLKWEVGTRDDGAVLVWPESTAAGGIAVRMAGEPPLDLCETASVVLTRRPLTEAETRSLTTMLTDPPF